MDITSYLTGITQNISNQTAPKSIPATVVGQAFSDLANLTKTNVELKLDITGSTHFITGVTSSAVTTALGFTPISGVTSSAITTALGFTPISGVTLSAVTTALGFVPLSAVTSNSLSAITISTSQIANGAVNSDKTIFFEPAKNIYNKNQNLTIAGHIQVNGTVSVSFPAWSADTTTDYIVVNPNTKYIVNSVGNVYFAEYTSGQTFVRLTTSFNSSTPLTTSANTAYARFQISTANSATTQIEVLLSGQSTPSTYEDYRPVIKEMYINPAVTAVTTVNLTNLVRTNVGKNIFNLNQTFLANSQVSGTGAVQTNPAFSGTSVSDFIPVSANTTYVTNMISQVKMTEYDFNQIFVKQQYFSSVLPNTTSANTAFIRLTMNEPTDKSGYMITVSGATPLFEPYQYEISSPISKVVLRSTLAGMSNRWAIPSKEYTLKGMQTSIYFQHALYRYHTDLFFEKMSGTSITSYNTRAVLSATTTATTTAQAFLYDSDFDVLDTKTFTVVVGDTGYTNGTVNWLSMGDSYTAPGAYQSRAVSLCSGLTTVGTIAGASGTSVFSEGRSGWQLASYFNQSFIHTNDGTGYMTPFLQPNDPYNYYGGTGMWITAMASSSTNLYATGVKLGISPSTGLRLSANTNDLMWVDANNTYKYYSGGTWNAIATSALTFTFNFAKYRTVYQIPQPNVFTFMLGINDFGNLLPPDVAAAYPAYKANLDTLIASVKADSPLVKFAVMLPTSFHPDSSDNLAGDLARRRSMTMFLLREMLIRDYDNRDVAENIFVIDFASSLDPVYGWNIRKLMPFPEYNPNTQQITVNDGVHSAYTYSYADDRRTMYSDDIHPEQGYAQAGTKIAAFIQATR